VTTLLKNRPTKFAGFGPSILAQQSRGRLRPNAIPKDRLAARTMLHDRCPLTPGVYGWLDSLGQICYVGKSKSLRKRLLSYFAKTPADKKAERIRQHSKRLVWEPVSGELLALIREQELIYRWRPDFNTQGQPTRRQPAFVCIGEGPAPNAIFTRQLTRNMSHVFGPIAGTGQLRAAVESLNQVFRLRDCPDKTQFEFNNQQQLFALTPTAKCIRFELGSCPGPCAGNCSSSEYRRLVEQAVCFLQGTDNSILLSLQRDMQTAAAAHSYERATVLRDQLENLQWLSRRLDALRSAQRTFNGVLPVAGRNRKTIWLVLRGGLLLGSATRPDQPERAAKAINSLSKSAAASHQLPANILEMNLQLIMISWFRKHPQLKQDILSFDAAIEYCHQQTGRQQKRIA
jgi:excinuclease ABC subunit C